MTIADDRYSDGNDRPTLKLHVWMNFPSHHQNGFFCSLRQQGVELLVTYYETVSAERKALGWGESSAQEGCEFFLHELGVSPEQRLQQLADFIHVIPGYGTALTRRVVAHACRTGIRWCHWSEPAHPGWRWWARWLTRYRYAQQVNRYSVGAFAQGVMARNDFVRWGIRQEKISYLTYAVDVTGSEDMASAPVEADERITEFAAGRGVFLFLGQLIHRKAVDVLLCAFAELNAPDWCLVLAGNGDTEKYGAQLQRLQLQQRALLLPAASWDQVGALYRASDVLVLPSRFDGWGVVANEAVMHAKALVMSSACGSSWHLLQPGINGYVATPASVASLAAAMRNYVRGGRELAHAHGEESHRISAGFSCDMTAERMIKILRGWLAINVT